MPYRQVYEDAPRNMALPVLKELPAGAFEISFTMSSVRIASCYIDGEYINYLYCLYCEGWIEGTPNEYRIDTLDAAHLAGRRGTEWYCCRCGREIAFNGIMS